MPAVAAVGVEYPADRTRASRGKTVRFGFHILPLEDLTEEVLDTPTHLRRQAGWQGC
jgi:hypothetical protein